MNSDILYIYTQSACHMPTDGVGVLTQMTARRNCSPGCEMIIRNTVSGEQIIATVRVVLPSEGGAPGYTLIYGNVRDASHVDLSRVAYAPQSYFRYIPIELVYPE